MLRSTLLHVARRHLRWLLCFALLLPVAQWASAVHAIAHATDAGRRSGPEPANHLQHCPVCPIAAAVATGGAASTPGGWLAATHAGGSAVEALVADDVPAVPRRPTNRGPPVSLA